MLFVSALLALTCSAAALPHVRQPIAVAVTGNGDDAVATPAPVPEMQVLFHKNKAESIYITTSVTFPDGSGGSSSEPWIVASTGQNEAPPLEIEAFVARSGVPKWTVQEANARTVTAGDTTASFNCTAVDGGKDSNCQATVYDTMTQQVKWTKVFEHTEGDGVDATRGAGREAVVNLGVSTNGAFVGVFTTKVQPPCPCNSYNAQLDVFHASSGEKQFHWELGNATMASTLIVGTETVTVIAPPSLYVVDMQGTQLWSKTFDETTEVLCASQDGKYIAHGFQTLSVWQQQADKTYSVVYSASHPGSYVGACGIVNDELVVGFNRQDYKQNTVQWVHLDGSSPTLRYSYDYPVDSASVDQDVVTDVAVSDDGLFASVSSWGGSNQIAPTINLFSQTVSSPVAAYMSPGSMWSTDIAVKGSSVYVTACGKHVPANERGYGGDLYSLLYTSK